MLGRGLKGFIGTEEGFEFWNDLRALGAVVVAAHHNKIVFVMDPAFGKRDDVIDMIGRGEPRCQNSGQFVKFGNGSIVTVGSQRFTLPRSASPSDCGGYIQIIALPFQAIGSALIQIA